MYSQVPNSARSSQIGTAFPHCSLYIIKDGQIQSKGAIGELCVGGPQITRGYCNRPDLTEKVFLRGYAGIEERIYRTGDVCRMLIDGSIEFLGRNDDQVKLRGRRIQLEEIDSLLSSACNVDIKSALFRDISMGSFFIVGFYVKRDHSAILESERVLSWFDSVLKTVPDYMIPKLIMPVAEIPRSQNGKLDHIKLLDYYHSFVDENVSLVNAFSGMKVFEHCEFNTDTEMQILNVVAGVLCLDVDPLIPLVHYGLDSLNVVRLKYKLNRIGFLISVADIFRNQSVRGISCFLYVGPSPSSMTMFEEDALFEDVTRYWREEFASTPTKDELWMPCSAGQIFCLDEWVRLNGKEYIGTFVIDLPLSIKYENALEYANFAWNFLLESTPILRTSFHSWNHPACPWYQVIHPFVPQTIFAVSGYDLVGIGSVSDFQILFEDVESVPSRAYLVQFQYKNSLCIQIHHAMYDGASVELLIETLREKLKSKGKAGVQSNEHKQIQEFHKFLKIQYAEMDTKRDRFFLGDNDSTIISPPARSFFNEIKDLIKKPKTKYMLYSKPCSAEQSISIRFISSMIYGLSKFTAKEKVLVTCFDQNREELTFFPTMVLFPLFISTDCVRHSNVEDWVNLISLEFTKQQKRNPLRLDYGFENAMTNISINILHVPELLIPTKSNIKAKIPRKYKKIKSHYEKRSSLLRDDIQLDLLITPKEICFAMGSVYPQKSLFQILCKSFDLFFG
jgi:aryl carrier-like protein